MLAEQYKQLYDSCEHVHIGNTEVSICQFMNSIGNFTIAKNMYTYKNKPVSRG